MPRRGAFAPPVNFVDRQVRRDIYLLGVAIIGLSRLTFAICAILAIHFYINVRRALRHLCKALANHVSRWRRRRCSPLGA